MTETAAEYIASLPREEQIAVERYITQRELTSSPASFAMKVTERYTEPWVPYNWLKFVNQKLVALVDGTLGKSRLLLTAPPRHGKSELCSVYFPAWLLNKYPDTRIILCGYGDDFAAIWGRRVRDVIEQNAGLLDVRVSKGSSAADRWDLEGHRGGMKSAGVGGQIVGFGASVLVIDDPIKNAEDVASLTFRDKQWEWWRSVAQTRLEPGGKVVIMHQRWHEDDLAGRILEHERDHWEVVNFPAIAEENDALGRVPGEPLCPERFPSIDLALRRESMGATAFGALYQQHPTPEGGGLFKKRDFRYYRMSPNHEKTYLLTTDDGNLLVPIEDCWRFVTVDLALSKGQSADYTAIAIWDVAGWLKPSPLILAGLIRERIEGSNHVAELRKVWQTWRPHFIGIESASFGSITIQSARREGLLIRELKAKSRPRDKEFRARDAALVAEQHRLFLPYGAPWLQTYENELLAFPSGAHDDVVDATSYAAAELLKGGNLRSRAEQASPDLDPLSALAWNTRTRKPVYDHPVLGRIPT